VAPLGRHEARKQLEAQFAQMSPEMQNFLTNPVNSIYMETAKEIERDGRAPAAPGGGKHPGDYLVIGPGPRVNYQ
jgi:hypothetical protein